MLGSLDVPWFSFDNSVLSVEVRRSHAIALQLPSASITQIQNYLSEPRRPLKALMNRKRVELLENGQLLYAPKPYQLLNFQVQPELMFCSSWDGDQLTIVLEQCRFHGLGRFHKIVQFHCQAWIRPEPERLMAKADLCLELSSTGATSLLPEQLLQRTGDIVLGLVSRRLEKRCHTGLKNHALNWIGLNQQ